MPKSVRIENDRRSALCKLVGFAAFSCANATLGEQTKPDCCLLAPSGGGRVLTLQDFSGGFSVTQEIELSPEIVRFDCCAATPPMFSLALGFQRRPSLRFFSALLSSAAKRAILLTHKTYFEVRSLRIQGDFAAVVVALRKPRNDFLDYFLSPWFPLNGDEVDLSSTKLRYLISVVDPTQVSIGSEDVVAINHGDAGCHFFQALSRSSDVRRLDIDGCSYAHANPSDQRWAKFDSEATLFFSNSPTSGGQLIERAMVPGRTWTGVGDWVVLYRRVIKNRFAPILATLSDASGAGGSNPLYIQPHVRWAPREIVALSAQSVASVLGASGILLPKAKGGETPRNHF